MKSRVAVIQTPPVLLDRARTLEAVIASIAEEAAEGASLLVFPEAYVPGYPTWAWRLKPGGDRKLADEIHGVLRKNAVDLAKGGLQPVQDEAAKHGVTVVLGIHEVDTRFSGTTLFNTVVVIGPDGEILNRHRKLMPTNPERMVWGAGDGSGLRVVDTPAGRLGALICWESYMPTARYALYAQDIDIYVAPTWDTGEVWLASMRHIAREGGCWVISTATALEESDVPADFPGRSTVFKPGEWINPGDAVVIAPGGGIVAGPQHRDKTTLHAEIDTEAARRARRTLDVCGHYSRPDVFSFGVDRRPLDPVSFED